MSNNVIVAPQGALAARAQAYLAQRQSAAMAEMDELGAGITSGFAVISYKGKTWKVKHRGVETMLMDKQNPQLPRQTLEVIIVKGAANISKIFYEKGFVEGASEAPDCWSTNGVTPDAGANKKQSSMCAGCPKNAWGSKVGDNGKMGKACQDSKRLAIVPADDIDNEFFGGPMLVRVPPASLAELSNYAGKMKQLQFPYFAIKTRLMFDYNEAYPKILFSAITPLTDEEFAKVEALRNDPRVSKILSEAVEVAQADVVDRRQAALADAFEQPPQAAVPAPVAQPAPAPQLAPVSPPPPPAPAPAPAPVPSAPVAAAPAPVAQPAAPPAPVVAAGTPPAADPIVDASGAVPEDFDALLGDLLQT